MSRSAKIAGVALAAGILMATAIAITVQDRSPKAEPVAPAAAPDADRLTAELVRCRTLTMPDAGCEAAWDEHRRHFLGQDRQAPSDAAADERAADAPAMKLSAPASEQGR